jgi:hypothetical protein
MTHQVVVTKRVLDLASVGSDSRGRRSTCHCGGTVDAPGSEPGPNIKGWRCKSSQWHFWGVGGGVSQRALYAVKASATLERPIHPARVVKVELTQGLGS